jgi:Domain of unknown function (DUF6379)
MGPLDKFILPDNALAAIETGCTLKIFSHWYRSLPLSAVGNLQIKINGEQVLPAYVKIELDGVSYEMEQIANLYKVGWFVLDPLVIHIDSMIFKKGTQYNVQVELGLLIPYVLTGKEEKPLLASTIVSKNLTCN